MTRATILLLCGIGMLVCALGAACSGAQPVASDMGCSPNADAAFAMGLLEHCPDVPSSECPALAELEARHQAAAEKECGL